MECALKVSVEASGQTKAYPSARRANCHARAVGGYLALSASGDGRKEPKGFVSGERNESASLVVELDINFH